MIFEKKSATFSAIFAVIRVFPPFLSGNFASAVISGDLSEKNTQLCCSHVTNFSGKVLINSSLYHCYGLFSWLYRRLCHLKRACGLKSLSRNASKSLIGLKKGYSFFFRCFNCCIPHTATTHINRKLISNDNSYQTTTHINLKKRTSYQVITHTNQNSCQKIEIYIH